MHPDSLNWLRKDIVNNNTVINVYRIHSKETMPPIHLNLLIQIILNYLRCLQFSISIDSNTMLHMLLLHKSHQKVSRKNRLIIMNINNLTFHLVKNNFNLLTMRLNYLLVVVRKDTWIIIIKIQSI